MKVLDEAIHKKIQQQGDTKTLVDKILLKLELRQTEEIVKTTKSVIDPSKPLTTGNFIFFSALCRRVDIDN